MSTLATLDIDGRTARRTLNRPDARNALSIDLLQALHARVDQLADQDGVYDPSDPNDRLLLGLKGTISEVELHTMRNRLERGKLNKAKRGEYLVHAPTGFVKDDNGQLILDPDEQVRAVVQLVFDKYMELGTYHAVFRYIRDHDIRFGEAG